MGFSQKDKKSDDALSLGLNFGKSAQDRFPFNNSNYLYKSTYLKAQINYRFSKKRKFSYEFNIEPSIYFSEHQLLNEYFVTPDYGDDYLEQRERFTKRRSFEEYAINFGFIVRYELFNNFSAYLLGSVGPMIATESTERLRKGLAFSDIAGLGLSLKVNTISFTIRGVVRHSSNADLREPNVGHNGVGFESGILFHLN